MKTKDKIEVRRLIRESVTRIKRELDAQDQSMEALDRNRDCFLSSTSDRINWISSSRDPALDVIQAVNNMGDAFGEAGRAIKDFGEAYRKATKYKRTPLMLRVSPENVMVRVTRTPVMSRL